MTSIADLSGAQLAEQLRDPQGASGVAVIEALAVVNAAGVSAVLERLDIAPSSAILELGCGLGDMAAALTGAARGVTYMGLDRSRTMIETALVRHAAQVRSGRAAFSCASSEQSGLPGGAFDRVFSIGLIHFWADPRQSLRECRRLLRSNGLMIMACLGSERAPPFALEENGFYLRDASQWARLAREAGFASVDVEVDDGADRPQGLMVTARP